jgi:hypothetical protein
VAEARQAGGTGAPTAGLGTAAAGVAAAGLAAVEAVEHKPGGTATPTRQAASPATPAASATGAPPPTAAIDPVVASLAPAMATAMEPAAARIAPPFSAAYRWQQGDAEGRATLVLSQDGARYTLALHRERDGQAPLHGISRGFSGGHGLAPERHVEGQAGRDRRALNFVREGAGQILSSDHAGALPLPAGVQDPVSWLVQLAALVDTDPSLRRPGAMVALWMAGPRGQLDAWQFEVIGSEAGAQGEPLLKLVRPASRPWDVSLEVWLDPAQRHLPQTVAWQRRDGPRQAPVQRLERRSLAWSGAGS